MGYLRLIPIRGAGTTNIGSIECHVRRNPRQEPQACAWSNTRIIGQRASRRAFCLAPYERSGVQLSRRGVRATAPSPVAPTPWERLSAHLRTVSNAPEGNSRRALRADVKVFSAWCNEREIVPLHAEIATILSFVQNTGRSKSPATVRRYVSSLSTMYRMLGEDNPAASEPVRRALRELPHREDRTQGTLALTSRLCRRLVEVPGDRLIDVRNRAMLTVAYDTLMRRSELVKLRVADLVRDGEGGPPSSVRVAGRASYDEAALVTLAPETTRLVSAWLGRTGNLTGRLFRSLRRGQALGDKLDASQVPRIYRQMALRAGLPADRVRRVTGLSPRLGALQDMIASGAPLPSILRAGRWKSAVMVQRYWERMLEEGALPKR